MSWFSSYIPADFRNNKLTREEMARGRNWRETNNIFNVLLNCIMELIDVENLPSTCDIRMIRRSMIWGASTVFFDAGKVRNSTLPEANPGHYMALFGNGVSGLNPYGWPTRSIATGFGGARADVTLYVPGEARGPVSLYGSSDFNVDDSEPNGVIIYDNVQEYPPVLLILQTARRLADMIRAIDVAVQNLKSPLIIGCEESQAKTIKTMLKDVEENMYAILTTKSMSLDSLQVWPTHMDSSIPKAFSDQFIWQLSLFQTFFGIDSNPSPEKKERQSVTEIAINDMFTQLCLQSRLASWQRGFDMANELFGLNMKVVLNKEVKQDVQDYDAGGLGEGEQLAEPIHGDGDTGTDD